MVEIENRLRNCKSLYNKDYKTFMADLGASTYNH